MIPHETPFVLLDDARPNSGVPARLYSDPIKTISAHSQGDVADVLDALRQAKSEGHHVAGYFGYEAGRSMASAKFSREQTGDQPLAWFGIFGSYQSLDNDAVLSLLPDPHGAWISKIRPGITRSEYERIFSVVHDYIQAGDIYQANLTFRAFADYAGNPLALYAAIRPNAAAGYGGVIWTGKQWLLSFSPELFFALHGRRVTAKPMKGTAKRLADAYADAAVQDKLQKDAKQRAENLMIVDLLRNDLSRVCDPGSVAVPDLFRIESYPTVHQMTSTVTGEMADNKSAADLIAAIFPCGSITGAPKIRAMEIIEETEDSLRGIYCGSIGRIDASGDAAFNVAIRTFCLNEKTKQLSLGLGSGIVADSNAGEEWAECLAKGGFAIMTGKGFDLIETMRFEPAHGILRLELHLERMKESARNFGFEFDRHAVRNQLHAVTFRLEKDMKIRLLLSAAGAIAIEVRDPPTLPETDWNVSLATLNIPPDDFRLHHKTSDRRFYDDARTSKPDADEVLLVDAEGFLTEGSFTSLFVERGGMLLTPPASRGLLPSVLRRELIEQGKACEQDLLPADLKDGFFLGNSLRGLIPAKLVA